MISTMQQMADKLTTSQSQLKTKISDIFLPSFDPDEDINITDWCQHIKFAKQRYNFEDYDIRMKATSLLKGRARKWADRWLVTTTTWEELEQNLIMTFEPEKRYSKDILKFRDHKFDTSKDISEFLSTSWFLWRKVTKDKLSNEDAVEAVIGTIDDGRIRMELINARTKSVPELISVASCIRLKRPNSTITENLLPKRQRYSEKQEFTSKSIYKFCNYCKKPGHVIADCRHKAWQESRFQKDKTKVRSDLTNIHKICSFCNGTGHTYETCLKRSKVLFSNINTLGQPKLSFIKVNFDNYVFDALLDSGADCSAIKESIASKIPGKRNCCIKYLKGLGSPVLSVQTLETTCNIDNINVDLTFHILPDSDLSINVLIGTNILKNSGLTIVINAAGVKLLRQTTIMHVQNKYPEFDKLNTDLTDDSEIDLVKILLNKYSSIFITGYPKTRVNTGKLEIRLKNPEKYVERRPYRLSIYEREKVKSIINELLENNLIRESRSPFSSPIILVKKKNGEDRMCVDYRELNSNTIRDHYPLPLISDQIDRLADAYYFSSLDMAAGFHQIPVSENSIEKTAFITPDGLYEYITMPFGLSNAPSVYQRCINKALQDLLSTTVIVYIDDVLCKSKDFTDGLTSLERVLLSLRSAGFSINIDKCSFFKRSVEYLGNIICDGKVRPSPIKIEALSKSPVPKTVRQIRQFNGLAGYFRRFIPNFSRLMIPLYSLTKQGSVFKWGHEQEETRNKIIKYLTSEPILSIFQEEAPIELYTDASSLGFGAVLIQLLNGRQHVVGYMSQRTTDSETRYHSYELETLAVVRAIKHFRHFLYGRKFKLITDCNSLKASKSKQDLLPRIHRWWAFLQHYNFEVEYRKGERIPHADFFSRNPIDLNVHIINNDIDWLQVEQYRDTELRPIIDKLRSGSYVENFTLEGNVLKRIYPNDNVVGSKSVCVIPLAFQWSLINSVHSALKHLGWEKTLLKIKESHWFPKMTTIVRSFVENCVTCKFSKGHSGAIQARLHPIPKPTAAFQVVHMDITGKLSPLNNEYVVASIDAFSKYVLLYYANDKSQHSTLAALKQLIHLFGSPGQIIVDGDRAFLGEFKKYCDLFGIQIHCIAPGLSRANGQIERVMSTLKNALTSIKNFETEQWHTALGGLQLAINCTANKSTGFSPLSILTGRQQCVPAELRNLVNIEEKKIDLRMLHTHINKRMADAAEKFRSQFDKSKAIVKKFKRKDYVLMKNNPRNQTSLDLKFAGPYEVLKVLDNDRYLIKRFDGRGRSRKVGHDQLRLAPNPGQQINVSAAIRNTENTLISSQESSATETIGSSTDTASEIVEV